MEHIKLVTPEELQMKVDEKEKRNYEEILIRINAQLTREKNNGGQSKLLAALDVNRLEVSEDVLERAIKELRGIGWKVSTRKVPFNGVESFEIPREGTWGKSYDHITGMTGIRVLVIHPSVSSSLVKNLRRFKEEEEAK